MAIHQRLRAGLAPSLKTLLLKTGVYSGLRRSLPSRQLAILRYHAVCERDAGYADPGICVPEAAFERHVRYLADNYRVLPLPEAVSYLERRKTLPRNAVAITFDDGYADNLQAARTLARAGLSATFYITAGCLTDGAPFWPAEVRYVVNALPSTAVQIETGPVRLDLDLSSSQGRRAAVKLLTKTYKSHPIPVRDDIRSVLRGRAGGVDLPRIMLTYDEVREMQALGMTIGSHTMTHPNLPNAGVEAARLELVQSKSRLEQEIGCPVTMFSYPNGGADRYMTPEIARLVKETGFAAATTSWNGFAGPVSDLYALERVQVAERLEDLVFALEVERFAFQPAPRTAQR